MSSQTERTFSAGEKAKSQLPPNFFFHAAAFMTNNIKAFVGDIWLSAFIPAWPSVGSLALLHSPSAP